LDNKLLPIGSVIKIHEFYGMIVGFDNRELEPDSEGRSWKSNRYIVVPWPGGVTESDDFRVTDNDDFEVIDKGYSDQLTDFLYEFMQIADYLSKGMPQDEFEKALNEAIENAAEEVL